MICNWVRVEYDGALFDVAPEYISPVGIGEAVRIAADAECELPSPGLVDAIWQAADLKLAPLPRAHNGTVAQMASEAVYHDQIERIYRQIAGREYTLLAGTHKDVCAVDGKVGLYGWHRLNGRVIQPFYTGHATAWKDYSQGLRLVRRVERIAA